jgi:hypothetical protein
MQSPDVHSPARRSRSWALASTIGAVALFAAACAPSDSVRVAWDAPTPDPKGYRILVDDRLVSTIPPPPLDSSCSCPAVWVPVPRGEHKVTLIAYNDFGDSAPVTVTVVRK